MSDSHNTIKVVADGAAVGTSVGAFLTNNLPTIALALSIVYTLFRIYETETVQKIIAKVIRIIRRPDEGTE